MEFKILGYVFAYIQQPWWDPEMFNPKNSDTKQQSWMSFGERENTVTLWGFLFSCLKF